MFGRFAAGVLAGLTISLALAAPAVAASVADAVYEAGTDSGMRYLSEHGGDLRVTLILQECGLNELAAKMAKKLPNSVEWFNASEEAAKVVADQRDLAAQVTRGYLLGFEAGTRLEFGRGSDTWRLDNCNAAAAAAR